jgi:hypothetical protein
MLLLWTSSGTIYFRSQLVDTDLDVLFHKSSSEVLGSSGKLICGIYRLGKVF